LVTMPYSISVDLRTKQGIVYRKVDFTASASDRMVNWNFW
jgi:hypothetical protein